MSKVYGVVLIGCGQMGKVHIDDIYYRDNINIIGVVDTDIEKAKFFQKKYGAKSYSDDYKKYLLDDEVDIFIVSTYAKSHFEIVKDIIDNNKHALCEKPIATTKEDCLKFYKCIKDAKKSKVLIGHILRHNDTYNKVKELIDSNTIGSPIIMRMVQNHHTMNWDRYRTLLLDCPPIVDCGVHYVDVMQWFTNSKIQSVSGLSFSTEPADKEIDYNYGLACYKLSDGSIGYYEAGWGKTIAASNLKEFIGPLGRISITLQRERAQNIEEGDLIEVYTKDGEYRCINISSNPKPTYNQLLDLIKMIESDSKGKITMEEALDAHLIAFDTNEAIKENKVVFINNKI